MSAPSTTLTNYLSRWLKKPFLVCALIAAALFGLSIYKKEVMRAYRSYGTALRNATSNTIVVITPTVRVWSRLGDLTMLAQTLMHVENIYWVVVEDDATTNPAIDAFLATTGIPYAYLATTNNGLPCRGWAQRNLAFDFLRKHRKQFGPADVVYFADDDNAYDYRLFDEFVRKVKIMGMWAVGMSAGVTVESPKVKNGKIVGWNVAYRPYRKYATDMAGFAVNLNVLLRSNAKFSLKCAGNVPEDCLLRQVNVPWEEIQTFGVEDGPLKSIYVWHRRTVPPTVDVDNSDGQFYVERPRETPKSCHRLHDINDMTYDEALRNAVLGDD